MKAALYDFDECPSYKEAIENLKQALRSEGLPGRVDLIPVDDDLDAHAKRFIGSPTIRLDGTITGRPSVEQIRQALQHA